MKIERLIKRKNLKVDSREIKKKDIFICTLGNYDKNKYIDEVYNKCSLVISNQSNHSIKTNNPALFLYEALDYKYHYPLLNKNIIGITGTDGKTTCATILRYMLNGASIGTNGLELNNYHTSLLNTTPNLIELFKCFNIINKRNISNIIMEVSSESYLTKRIPYLFFDVGIFLNISKEHLDKHPNFKNYLNCKKELLKNSRIKIINRDSHYYHVIKKNINNYLTFGKKKSDLQLIKYNLAMDKTTFLIRYKKKKYWVNSPLLGIYNIYNLMASILTMLSLGYEIEDVIKRISLIKTIPGRMEKLNYQDKHIIIDYAHTICATKKVLFFLAKYANKKIITIVGCAGGRFKEKRKIIGKYVLQYSFLAIFTMDDPRDENPYMIVDEMLNNSKRKNYLIEINRQKAIEKALSMANDNNIILILGKGRDNYMAIGDKKIKYSDISVIDNYLNTKKV